MAAVYSVDDACLTDDGAATAADFLSLDAAESDVTVDQLQTCVDASRSQSAMMARGSILLVYLLLLFFFFEVAKLVAQ